MVADTSALLAVLFREPDRDLFLTVSAGASAKLLSSVSFPEASLVIIGRKGTGLLADFDACLERLSDRQRSDPLFQDATRRTSYSCQNCIEDIRNRR
jgi:uncharacterized protein with PIN domain